MAGFPQGPLNGIPGGAGQLTRWDSELLVEARISLLKLAVPGPIEVGTYTDEEVAVLEQPGGNPPAPAPWLAQLDAQQTEITLATARRGLSARGLYRVTSRGQDATEFDIEVGVMALALMSLRRLVSSIVMVERHIGDQADWQVFYPQAGQLWLRESIDGNGIHRFGLARPEHWVDKLMHWSEVGNENRSAPYFETLVPPGEARLPYAIEQCSTMMLITRFDATAGETSVGESWSSLHVGSEGCFLGRAGASGVQYVGVGDWDVRRHWSDILVNETEER
ncbi:hypothetical protein [Kineosporia babensis]|uniref:Uncharacterized protein n=1 Tax=Kineosporia babensis TaxID=499548 RepID=A0A9X1NEH2_9ACTN|nr:hypothetical protein [Kineosporia babensis]MCD5311598.1 hypothetical protein [Kineosporia babensis]